jgi:hypothetical protein
MSNASNSQSTLSRRSVIKTGTILTQVQLELKSTFYFRKKNSNAENFRYTCRLARRNSTAGNERSWH